MDASQERLAAREAAERSAQNATTAAAASNAAAWLNRFEREGVQSHIEVLKKR